MVNPESAPILIGILKDGELLTTQPMVDALARAGMEVADKAELDALRAVAEAARTKVSAEIDVNYARGRGLRAEAKAKLSKAAGALVVAIAALDKARGDA